MLQEPGGGSSIALGHEDEIQKWTSGREEKEKSTATADEAGIDPSRFKTMPLHDLRFLSRSNGLQPGGSKEMLVERLEDAIRSNASIEKTKQTENNMAPPFEASDGGWVLDSVREEELPRNN